MDSKIFSLLISKISAYRELLQSSAALHILELEQI